MRKPLLLLCCALLLTPAFAAAQASAQASITGVVRDSSGAPSPTATASTASSICRPASMR
jgi:hypothetical protein